MSTGATMAVIALTASQAAAAAARRVECQAILDRYDPKAASVTEMREYASCVTTIYGTGEPLSAAAVLMIKLLIIATLAAAVVGGWLGWRNDRDWMEAVMGVLLGAMAPAILFGAVILAGLGIQFVLS